MLIRTVLDSLLQIITSLTEDLKNRLIRVKKQNQPKSSQQVFVIQEY
ncbi:MAG: hypothetical protein V7K67_17770 [Nostoc sp.]